VATLELRYDSMDNLLLRKVLDPTRPEHRLLLAGARSASEWPRAPTAPTGDHCQDPQVCSHPNCSRMYDSHIQTWQHWRLCGLRHSLS
jgi:hypothetical protein